MPNPGDVILAFIPFTDSEEVKKRPALVLFEEFSNVIVAGITSNTRMDGIPLTISDGAIKECVIKLNYLFTISGDFVGKVLFKLNPTKKLLVFNELVKKFEVLKK